MPTTPTKISADPLVTSLGPNDDIPVVQGGANKRFRPSQLPVSTAQAEAIGEKADQADVDALSAALGGFSIVEMTQGAYDALSSKDPNTLYVIVGA